MTTKQEFMRALDARLAEYPEAERARLTADIADLIDDRVGMGMPEETAIAALGDVDALIRDAATNVPAVPATVSDDADCRGDIREVRVHTKNADVLIKRERLENGAAARIQASEANCFTWRLEDGALTVAEADRVRRGLFRREPEVTLILSELNPEALIADTYGGDIEVQGVVALERAVLAASSGDVRVSRFGCGGRMEITTRSGDIALKDVTAEADCKLEALSGDIELKRVYAANLRIRTTSGDIEGSEVRAGAFAAGTSSGDVEIEGIAAEASMLCETGSGDIELSGASSPRIRLCAESGDVELDLTGADCDIRAESSSGEIELPQDFRPSEAASQVYVRTVSGDIRVGIG